MFVNMRATHLFFLLIIAICHSCRSLYADVELMRNPNRDNPIHHKSLDSYLLPQDHPLNGYLKIIFTDADMFKSTTHLRKAGFRVKRGHRKIMVAAHPHIPQYLFKKFPNSCSQTSQLRNFIKRIEGAEVVRNYIKEHNFKHLVVPQKWLYKLPRHFSKADEPRSYILIVDNMDIYGDWEDPNGVERKLYYNMDREMLTELCTILHDLGGCDAYPRNQPFTRSGKIAFVDTEHVGQMKGHFIKHIVPALNEELQAYALALWMKLEEEEQARNRH